MSRSSPRRPALQVGIDATLLAGRRVVGISRFVANLVEQLVEVDPETEYYLFYRPRALRRPHLLWKPASPRFHIRILLEPFHRGLFRRLDVFHSTYQRLPRTRALAPYLGTLHDIFYLSRPDMGSERTRSRWQARYRDVAERSRLIMTLSEFSKGEIVRHLGVDPARVRVVYLASSAGYEPQPEGVVAAARSRYGLSRPYILFGGGFGRRKNAAGAVRAFATALPRLPADLCLAISGSGGPTEAEAMGVAAAAGICDRVRVLGYVPDADHPALISGCVLYFFPSELEGFGLPALEAMACGAPLVAASTTSLPEACGHAAVLVDPADVPAMAEALTAVATDQRRRDDLRRRGLERSRLFTWRKVAQEIAGLYREIAGGR